jgi:ribosome-associated protein
MNLIPDNELTFVFGRSSGPGGQNVNKVETAVQLRFNVRNSSSLSGEVKDRLIRLAGRRMTREGILLIDAKRYRTQEQNRADAENRLSSLIQKAMIEPKKRKRTIPTAASKKRRIEAKKQRGQIKRLRRQSDE